MILKRNIELTIPEKQSGFISLYDLGYCRKIKKRGSIAGLFGIVSLRVSAFRVKVAGRKGRADPRCRLT